jgi:Ca2+-binding RTX toxin-like protein
MASSFEPLESRRLFAASLEAGGVLLINGTYKDDTIVIVPDIAGLHVAMNKQSQYFALNSVQSIRIHGRRGNDFVQLWYAPVYNQITGNTPIRISGEGGNDFLETVGPPCRMYGGSGDDTIRGHFGIDTLFGGAGDDLLGGRFNRDKVYGDDGNDTLYGSGESDRLDGGNGNDLLKGDQGNDVLRDTAGQNTLLGGDGDDRLFNGPSATGVMTGGAGADQFSDSNDASDFDALDDDATPLADPI